MRLSIFKSNSNDKVMLKEVTSKLEFEFILRRIYEEAETGHFNPMYTNPDPAYQGGLAQQIYAAINDLPFPFPPTNPRNGAGATIYLLEYQHQLVGFVLLVEDMPGSWKTSIEIQLMSISPEFRRKGIGSKVIQEILLRTEAPTIYARCYSQSTEMVALLQRFNFSVTEVSEQGTKTLTHLR